MNLHSPTSQTHNAFRLSVDIPMTFEYRHELESVIIEAMRRHRNFEADLSDVSEIDLYGVHLLGLLHSVGAVVAISPEVEATTRRLLASRCGTSLGRVARRMPGLAA
ncbi:MAG TPA: hypothetical protein VF096_13150 [Azonexus sp.]